ncbi:hypothetical protein PInf_031035 [Phytophthora infestans]|nr:hypothetical protein PInf_031035 [Phytophthora infestans]
MGGSHIIIGHHLFLSQAQLVAEPIQALVSSRASSLGIFQIPLEVVDPGLELVDLGSGERHLPKEMFDVVSHAITLTGGAIQPSSQVTDLDCLIGQQASRILGGPPLRVELGPEHFGPSGAPAVKVRT